MSVVLPGIYRITQPSEVGSNLVFTARVFIEKDDGNTYYETFTRDGSFVEHIATLPKGTKFHDLCVDDTLNATEALYAFCGWLTTRKEPLTMSSATEATSAVECISQFLGCYNLTDVRDGWENTLVNVDDHPLERPLPKGTEDDRQEKESTN